MTNTHFAFFVGMLHAHWRLGVASAVLGPLSRWLNICAIVGLKFLKVRRSR